MEPRERLKRYLEQRRELGERELVLDGMTVEDVMRIVGAAGAGSASTTPSAASASDEPRARVASAPADVGSNPAEPPATTDWREALRASGVASPTSSSPSSEKPVSKRYEFPRPADREPEPAMGTTSASSPAPSPATADRPSTSKSAPSAPPPTAPTGLIVGTPARDLFGGDTRPASLDELAETIRVCTKCRLYATATNPVPGEGDPNAELVCVGEAPGANEDATGRPFVGQAGQLLTKILAAINLRREDVFICNVLKHRPPGNRNPLPDEVAACSPYLVQQLEAIHPKVIVAFGTFAAQTLLNTKLPIGKLRGSVHRYYGIPLIVTYHPAALLRNPAWKRPTWEDVQLARRILDTAPRA